MGMKLVAFYIAYSIIWLITLLPFSILYLISDIFYLLLYHVLGYRRKVVAENLQFAFPEKSAIERKKIEKAFFHHFCDSLLESFKVLHLSKTELNKRFVFLNIDVLNDYYRKRKNVILISGHYGNWEWMVGIDSYIKHKFLAIYKPLADTRFNELIKGIREKYAGKGEMVAMNDSYKVILKYQREKQLFVTCSLETNPHQRIILCG